jgi:hypothetical protein
VRRQEERQEWRKGGLKFSSYFYIRELVKHIICYLFVDLPFSTVTP